MNDTNISSTVLLTGVKLCTCTAPIINGAAIASNVCITCHGIVVGNYFYVK